MSKLTAVDKSMVSGRLSGLLTYSNFVHAVSGATVSINRLWNFVYSMSNVWNLCIYMFIKLQQLCQEAPKSQTYLVFPNFYVTRCNWLVQWLYTIHKISCVQSVMDETWLFTNFLMLQKSIWMLLLTNALLNGKKNCTL